MFTTKLLLAISFLTACYAIKCYSGMQGSVNGDSIGQIELIECNGTDWCVKLPSYGQVGRKTYEGAQYSCDFGECRKDTCEKRDNGETICCCNEDECNYSSKITFFKSFLFIVLAIYAFINYY